MRLLGCAALCALAFLLLPACAPQSEEERSAHAAGGTLPWNKPEKWEGPGVLGSQMSQMQGGN